MMKELFDPEVEFKTELDGKDEAGRQNYLIGFWKRQAENMRDEGLRLEAELAAKVDRFEEYEYYEDREREQGAEIRRLREIVRGSDNARLSARNYRLQNDNTKLESQLSTAKFLREKDAQKAARLAKRSECSRRQAWRLRDKVVDELDNLMIEAAFVYNELRDEGVPEMSSEEMYEYLISRGEESVSEPPGYYGSPLTPEKEAVEPSAEFWARRRSQDDWDHAGRPHMR